MKTGGVPYVCCDVVGKVFAVGLEVENRWEDEAAVKLSCFSVV